jgi:hypothetical protein
MLCKLSPVRYLPLMLEAVHIPGVCPGRGSLKRFLPRDKSSCGIVLVLSPGGFNFPLNFSLSLSAPPPPPSHFFPQTEFFHQPYISIRTSVHNLTNSSIKDEILYRTTSTVCPFKPFRDQIFFYVVWVSVHSSGMCFSHADVTLMWKYETPSSSYFIIKFSLCLTKHHAMKTYWKIGSIAPLILWPRH